MSTDNREIAAAFDRTADLLEAHRADHYRVRAYREGASTLRTLDRPVGEILDEGGHAALVALPHIGQRLASVIEDIVANGRFHQLDRLTGVLTPEEVFASVPGVGPKLAGRLHHTLGIETLEELELAAHDGRLERVPGFGPRRAHLLREVLDAMLRRSTRRRARLLPGMQDASGPRSDGLHRPPVGDLLAVDAEYRTKAEAGRLHKIRPKRFNPNNEAWLPILHVTRGGWDYDVMYSNTARAHELGRTRDWVVIFYARDGDEGQCTVVTEYRGPLMGRRVVRGREAQCTGHYATEAGSDENFAARVPPSGS